nr:restriction endonuclease [Argonema antarcticum]
MFWPSDLSEQEAELSIIPKLLETQEEFISILSVKVNDLNGLFQVVNAATLSANMFIKHLVVLADFGGENLKRLNSQFNFLFPSKELDYIWKGKSCLYQFEALPVKGQLSNEKLGIDGKKLLKKQTLSTLHKDIIALLLLASSSKKQTSVNFLAKCEIGNYIGEPEKLDKFIKQRYIWVSRITSGAKSNTLGQIAQKFVKDYLDKHLNISDIKVEQSGHLPGIRHTDDDDNRATSFDIVISKLNKKYAAIEVSFQVTTNSVIERKAGQAKSRFDQIEKAGYKIAYVIDGAGNFERESALRTICSYSHCTVAFSEGNLDLICEFMRNYFSYNEE